MHVANVANLPVRALQVAQAPAPNAEPVHVGSIDSLDALAALMHESRLPSAADIALRGKPLLAHHLPGDAPRELVSFGGSDHVILSVFDAHTGKAALVQIAENDQDAIDQTIAAVLEHFASAHPETELTVSMFGGAWTTSCDDTGAKVRDALLDKGITPTWHQWSSPMDNGEDNHGVMLDPSTGQMTVFQHATELADECYNRLSDDEVWSDFEKAGPDWDVLHDWSIFQKYDLAPLGRGWER